MWQHNKGANELYNVYVNLNGTDSKVNRDTPNIYTYMYILTVSDRHFFYHFVCS